MVNLHDTKGSDWNSMAGNYKKMAAETSHKPVEILLARANSILPFSEATGILDNGCGPGPVMERLLKDYKIPESCPLTCSDFSDGMIKQVVQTKEENMSNDSASPWNRVETVVQNAMDLQSVESNSRSHVTAGWVYFMTPDPQKCLSESLRVLKPGGALSCSSWDTNQWMEMCNEIVNIRPDKKLPEIPIPWRTAEGVKRELETAGFKDVVSEQVHTTMSIQTMKESVEFFITMPFMVTMTKDMNESELEKLREAMTKKGKEYCAEEPGVLHGTAIVTAGRKE